MSKISYYLGWIIVSHLLLSASTNAGGLWLNEFGSPAMGRARAGAETGVSDASTVLHNPSTISGLDKEQWLVAGTVIDSSLKFKLSRNSAIAGDDPGSDAGSTLPGGAAFYARPINEQWAWGVSFGGTAGAGLDYSDSWSGRYQATKVDLLAVVVAPAVSYQVNEWLSIGGGMQLMFTELELNAAVPIPGEPDGRVKIDGNDWEISFSLGTMIQATKNTKLGLVYQHEFTPEYGGDVNFSRLGLAVGVDTGLTLSRLVRLGVSHQCNPLTALHLSLGWDDWSELDDINLSTDSAGATISANWEDTYHYALGVEYILNSQWNVSAGIAYDTSPVSKTNRTAQLPLDRQVRYTIGAQHRYLDDFSWGTQLVYADLGDAEIEADLFAGKFTTNHTIFLSVNFSWRL